jgi:fused signal recognition particle receptor
MFTFFSKKKLDEDMLQEIEDQLLISDVGISFTNSIVNRLRKSSLDKDVSLDEIKAVVAGQIAENFQSFANKKTIEINRKPFIILIAGTNGSGKTTSIAKLTNYFAKQNKKVLLVPGDTFRAGAKEQLRMWANRLEVNFFDEEKVTDPAALAYKSIEYAIANTIDIVIIDTAGRLDNNEGLMAELKKIDNTIKKIMPQAPHESILVVDGTIGQIALQQARGFNKEIDLTGIIMTKLDSGAKGGMLINLVKTVMVPIYFIGTGETIEDFQEFNEKEYINNLLDIVE